MTVSELPESVTLVHLARYDVTTHTWVMAHASLTPASGSVTATTPNPQSPIPNPLVMAIVTADVVEPAIVVPSAGEILPGIPLVMLPVTATSTGTIDPPSLPPAGGTATGTLTVQSPEPLPSGTIVQTNITETFTLASGAIASEETRTQDLVL